mmetsp:Transcript_34658/g.40849  ORF Transcript_34658/g.40849 Transcript_34658/m.40849 type:complete len:311 (-) Transcript_34658:3848-4780(-)
MSPSLLGPPPASTVLLGLSPSPSAVPPVLSVTLKSFRTQHAPRVALANLDNTGTTVLASLALPGDLHLFRSKINVSSVLLVSAQACLKGPVVAAVVMPVSTAQAVPFTAKIVLSAPTVRPVLTCVPIAKRVLLHRRMARPHAPIARVASMHHQLAIYTVPTATEAITVRPVLLNALYVILAHMLPTTVPTPVWTVVLGPLPLTTTLMSAQTVQSAGTNQKVAKLCVVTARAAHSVTPPATVLVATVAWGSMSTLQQPPTAKVALLVSFNRRLLRSAVSSVRRASIKMAKLKVIVVIVQLDIIPPKGLLLA